MCFSLAQDSTWLWLVFWVISNLTLDSTIRTLAINYIRAQAESEPNLQSTFLKNRLEVITVSELTVVATGRQQEQAVKEKGA